MSIAPRRSDAAFLKTIELSRWDVPGNLVGKVLESFEKLKELFPENEEFGEVYLRQQATGMTSYGFDRYSRPMKGKDAEKDVAYRCHRCKKIIIGPPKLKIEDTFLEKPLQPGRSGLEYSCRNCNSWLYHQTWKVN